MRKRSIVLASVMVVLASFLLLVGCGNSNVSNTDNSQSGKAQVVKTLTVGGLDFTFDELDVNPRFAPGDMPDEHFPFSIKLNYSGDGDAAAALSTLRSDATLTVNGVKVEIATTGLGDDFVTLLCSTPDDLQAADLSIELVYDGNKLVIK